MAEVGLQGAGVMTCIGKGEAAGVAQHVRVGFEFPAVAGLRQSTPSTTNV
jgi:hypothetical protein